MSQLSRDRNRSLHIISVVSVLVSPPANLHACRFLSAVCGQNNKFSEEGMKLLLLCCAHLHLKYILCCNRTRHETIFQNVSTQSLFCIKLNASCFWWFSTFLPRSHQRQCSVCVCLHLFVWMLFREIEHGRGCLCVFAYCMCVCNHASSGQGTIAGASLLAVPISGALFPGLTFGPDTLR